MADITVTAADVRPLPGAMVERYDAGGTLAAGDSVYMASDGAVEEADGSASPSAYAIGIIVSGPEGKVSFVAGDALDVVVWGRVTGFSGMTPGDTLYQSDTAGALADAAGTVSHQVGKARSATVAFIQPEY